MIVEQNKKLTKLIEEYTNLLRWDTFGGEEAAKIYLTKSIPLGLVDEEIKFLQTEIPKMKKKLSDEGFILENNT